MAEARVEILREFPVPVERLFATLAEHENLARIFAPATVERLRDGAETRNGVGSARRLRIRPAGPFVETVTAYRENELIEYRITEGSPLRNHVGIMQFSPLGPDRSRLHYVIEFDGRFPFVARIVAAALDRGINRGLTRMRF